jgi:glutathione peroxidase
MPAIAKGEWALYPWGLVRYASGYGMVDDDALFRIPLVGIDGEPTTLESYRGKVLLIVNVASACGFTPQYQGLEVLFRRYRDRGFAVLGFPCNQFGRQEPGSASDIQCFTKERYSVSFPLFAKVEVNGANAHPLYRLLKQRAKGLLGTEFIKWNFTKFLIDRQGQVVNRFASATTPETLDARIRDLL